jgi:aspartyl-tRNA(Asn)/glutamyl-tRNA(Gln) amidotransferase subunit A
VEVASPGWEDPREAFGALVALETDLKGMRALVDRDADRMTPSLVAFVRRAWTAEELTSAGLTRKAVVNKMWRFMRQYDLLLTPTLAVPAFPVESDGPAMNDGRAVRPSDWSPFTFLLNLTGQPAATVPAGWTDDGLPVGLQIIGRHLDDPLVLRAAAAFEAAAPWADRWPPLLATMGQ